MDMMKNLNAQQSLLRRLQIQGFALDDVKLFLDTHPDNQLALDYYNKYQAMRDQTYKEYTDTYGPMSAERANVTDRWTWVDTPWPWEGEM